MTLTVGSLFSGIGGLDLGLERVGMTVRWQSEIDPYACRVLAKHWPDVPNLGDITTIDWSNVEPVDVICGGYPCQPFSLAGARQGTDDARHLWPYFANAIRHLRPRWALLENVPGHLSLGFGDVLGDLAALGFDADWDCIPASAVGAPHLRYRIFIVAHANEQQHESRTPALGRASTSHVPALADADRAGRIEQRGSVAASTELSPAQRCGDVADTEGLTVRTGLRTSGSRQERWGRLGDSRRSSIPWATEPDVGRVAHGVPARVDRLRALGNAVVPQVAEHVGRLIMNAA